jgi:hypothetical protein
LKITADESAELNFGFGTTAPNPWVKVSGRVVGAALITGPARVALESEVTATMEAYINPDGTFEFPRVLPDTDYVARMTPESILSSAPKVNVAAKDITGLEVVIAREREVKGRASVENGGTVPAFLLSLRNAAGSRRITVKPDPSGAFTIKLPEDERNVDIVGLSIAYTTKSFTYGSTNLLKKPLKIASESSTMDIVFGIGDTLLANVRGRVTNLDADSRASLTLHGISDVSSFETALDANGAFSFTKIPTGTYAPSLTEDGPSFGLMQPSIITVAGKDLLNVEITAPRQNGRKDAPRIEDIKTGARIRELGVNVGESSAVANLRTINTAEVTYLAVSGGNYGTIADLIDAGLLDETFKQTKAGFRFGIIATGSDYAAVAVPASSSSGRYGYYSVPDAVVRYSLLDALSPRNEGGNPVR